MQSIRRNMQERQVPHKDHDHQRRQQENASHDHIPEKYRGEIFSRLLLFPTMNVDRHKTACHGVERRYYNLGIQYKLIGKRHKSVRICHLRLNNGCQEKADSHIDCKSQKLGSHIDCQSFFIHNLSSFLG